MKTPHERLGDFLASYSEEDLAAIAQKAAEPGYVPEPVELRDDPDPLGRDWDWLGASDDQADTISIDEVNRTPTRPLLDGRRIAWASGVAASIAAVAAGTWFALYRGPLRERDVAAWVAQRLEIGGGGVRVAAPAGDEEVESPLIAAIDRPRDAAAPSTPNVYAPLRIQEQLVVPEVTPSEATAHSASRPVRSITDIARPGDLFYLEFTTASTPTPGTAVVASARGDSWHLLRDEISVAPAEGTGYFGPIKMGDVEASYFVVLADRTGTPLLNTASEALSKNGGGAVSPDVFRDLMAAALESSGHSWFAVQRIEVKPAKDAGAAPKPAR